MSNKQGFKDTLMKSYEKVIEARMKSDEALSKKSELFKQNAKTIQASLKAKLDAFSERLKEEEQAYNDKKKALKTELQQNQNDLKKEEKAIQTKASKELASLEDDYEKKQSLNNLKEQKIETDYQTQLDRIAKKMAENQTTLDKSIESSTQAFYDQTVQLEKDTDTKNANYENAIKQKNIDYSSKIDQVTAATKKDIDTLEQTKNKQIETFKEALKKAVKAYKEAIKPADDDFKKVQATQAKERQKIVDEFDEVIAKITKYKKEKEKLGDNSEVNRFNKELKAHRKEKEETLDAKDEEHRLQREPYEEKQRAISDEHKQRILTLKTEHINTILETLVKIKERKTDDMIQTNEVNIERLIEEARFNHQQTTLKIDYDIQLINFNQTLEEARLEYDRQTAILKPETQKLNDAQKTEYHLKKNELTTKRNTEKINLSYNKDIRLIDQKIDLEHLDHNRKKLAHQFDFDTLKAEIEYAEQNIHNDYLKESILVGHYYHNAKNYTALKNDEILTYKPSYEKAIDHERKNQIDQYKTILKQAEKDHKRMIEHINETFEMEYAIYKDALDHVEKHHTTTIKDLMAKQALERNKDLSLIESLDAKKDKARIKRLKRNLHIKQEHHDETIALKKRELEQHRQLYQRMLDQTKNTKMHSTEEADTLLIHIKDQVAEAIESVEKQAQNARKTFDHLYYEVKHNANLFHTFQLQRQEDTLEHAKTFKAARSKSQQDLLNHHKQQLTEQLGAIKKACEAMIETYENERQDRTKRYEEKIASTKRTHEENIERINDQHEQEAKKLTQQIARLERDFEARLKTLTNEKKKEKEACFEKKDQAEKTHQDTLARREEETKDYREERQAILTEDLNTIRKNYDALMGIIEQNPITTITEKDLNDIEPYLDGQKPLPND